MSIQVKEYLPDQRTPAVGPRQVKNDEGGFVYPLDDIMRLKRFVILGCDGVQYYANDHRLREKNTISIRRLIEAGRGLEAVRTIKEISVARRNVRQGALLYALAILARSSDEQTKKAAYDALTDVCRIPTHLFHFIEFCREVSVASREGDSGGKGWGRAHRNGVVKWYTNFSQKPEKLALLISKYKQRVNTTHKDVLRRAHPKGDCEDFPKTIGFILKYIVMSLEEARNHYRGELENNERLRQVAKFLEDCDLAMRTLNVNDLRSLITEHKLSREHCPTQMLGRTEVWSALLPHMNVEALIRNLGRMTGIGLFATGSVEEDLAVKIIRSINTEGSLRVEEEEATEIDQELSWHNQGGRYVNILHPIQILVGWKNYKRGRGERGSKTWAPNSRILEALMDAYDQAYQRVEPTGKKFFLAVHMSVGMAQPVFAPAHRPYPLDYSEAMATMMMVTRRTEEHAIIKGLTDQLEDLHIDRHDNLRTVVEKSFPRPYGGIDCAMPMKHAVENRIQDIDVFVIYTDSQTIDGNVHANEALREYREYSSNPAVKMVVVGMTATEFTIAHPDDPNMLDIVGFDPAAPRVISEFVRGL